MNKSKCYIIYCSTGCSCCRDQNHFRGPYQSREIAEEAKSHFSRTKLLSSQYSSSGNYSIEERNCEILPDGRIIIDDRIHPRFMTEADFTNPEEEFN